jgi:mRNA interferase HigB
MKLISNKALVDFSVLHRDANEPLQDFRRRMERGSYANFAQLREAFPTVDKVGARYVFNICGNKYRMVAGLSFLAQCLWVKAILTHAAYDKGAWK